MEGNLYAESISNTSGSLSLLENVCTVKSDLILQRESGERKEGKKEKGSM